MLIRQQAEFGKKIKRLFVRIIPGVLKQGVPVFFFLCIVILAVYGSGSGFSDKSLLILLRLLRYTAFFLALVSFFALAYAVRRLTKRRQKRFALYLALYLLSGVFGLSLAVFCTVIIAISAGN